MKGQGGRGWNQDENSGCGSEKRPKRGYMKECLKLPKYKTNTTIMRAGRQHEELGGMGMPDKAKRSALVLVWAALLVFCPGGLSANGQEVSVTYTFPLEGDRLVRLDFPVIVEFTGPADPEGFSFALFPIPADGRRSGKTETEG
jgi:hypothetical protein